MTSENFEEIFELIKDNITKENTQIKGPILYRRFVNMRIMHKSPISMHTPPKSHSRNTDFFRKQQRTVQDFFS